MTTKEVLIAARKLIEKKENWIGGESTPVVVTKPFCISTAFCEVTGWSCGRDYNDAMIAIQSQIGIKSSGARLPAVFKWNDTHTHAEVLEAFDKAIAAQP